MYLQIDKLYVKLKNTHVKDSVNSLLCSKHSPTAQRKDHAPVDQQCACSGGFLFTGWKTASGALLPPAVLEYSYMWHISESSLYLQSNYSWQIKRVEVKLKCAFSLKCIGLAHYENTQIQLPQTCY